MSQYDVEMYFGDELDRSVTWWLQEIDAHGRPKGKPLWVLRRRRRKAVEPREAEAPWKRLKQDVAESVEPIRVMVEAYRTLKKALPEFDPQQGKRGRRRE